METFSYLIRLRYSDLYNARYPTLALITDRNTWSINGLVTLTIDIIEFVLAELLLFDDVNALSEIIGTVQEDLSLNQDVMDILNYLTISYKEVIKGIPKNTKSLELIKITETEIYLLARGNICQTNYPLWL